jgi:hypothetical protein
MFQRHMFTGPGFHRMERHRKVQGCKSMCNRMYQYKQRALQSYCGKMAARTLSGASFCFTCGVRSSLALPTFSCVSVWICTVVYQRAFSLLQNLVHECSHLVCNSCSSDQVLCARLAGFVRYIVTRLPIGKKSIFEPCDAKMLVGLAFPLTQRHQKVRVPRSVTRHELLVEKVQ